MQEGSVRAGSFKGRFWYEESSGDSIREGSVWEGSV